MAPPLEQTVEKSQREARNILKGYKSTSEYTRHLYLSKKLRYKNLRLYLIYLADTLELDSPEEYLEALKERSFEPWLTFTDEDLGTLHYDHNKSDEHEDEHEKVDNEVLNKLVKTLSPIERGILHQKFHRKRNYTEIGKFFEISRNTTRKIANSALKKLKIKLTELGFGEHQQNNK